MKLKRSTRWGGDPCCAVLAALAVIAFASPAAAQTGGGYTLTSSTLDSGGDTVAEGGEYEAAGSSGQTDAGTTTGGDYSETGGFWSGMIEPVTVSVPGTRYLSITPRPGSDSIALWLTGDPIDPAVSCLSLYVQPDGTLGSDAVFLLPEEWGTVYVHDGLITPRRAFAVEAEVFDAGDPPVRSTPSGARALAWGDLNGDGVVGGHDLIIFVDAYLGNEPYWRGDSCPEVPDQQVDGDDLLCWIDAFYGEPYPFAGCGGQPRGGQVVAGPETPTSLSDVRLTVTPRASHAKPGEPVSVDVFLEGIHDVRMYQVAIKVRGGVSGGLVLQDVSIDTARKDYIFRGYSPVSIPDPRGQRAVSALWVGGVSAVGTPRYLTTFTFVPSRNAKGLFKLRLRREPHTMLRDSQRRPIAVAHASGAVITVGLEMSTSP